MQPWLLDADNIRASDTFDDGYLHKTDATARFLQRDAVEQCFVVATKGFGKTFLLKAKRLNYGRSGMLWLPENDLVDKPVGRPRVFSVEEAKNILNDEGYWTTVWTISLTVAVLKLMGVRIDNFECASLADIYHDTHLLRVTDLFANLLSLPRDDYFRSRADLDRRLTPAFRSCQSQIAIFVDNVDEFFDIHLEGQHETSHAVAGALIKDWWYSAQIGLANAIYQLRGANHHVKMFCSIRREAFEKLVATSKMAQQFMGAAIYLTYSDEDLLEIFKKNVRLEAPERLVEPNADDPIRALLGPDLLELDHLRTGERESFCEYLMRHTLRRPRDVVQVGRNLADMPPRKRTSDAVKATINATAQQIGASYLWEVAPHVSLDFAKELFARLPSNVLRREQIVTIAKEHEALWGENHPFCTLYKSGLLGYVDGPTPSNKRVQYFTTPGEKLFEEDGALPPAEYYLIHSVLDNEIRMRSETYRKSFNRWNIISAGREWREPNGQFFLVDCDIVNSSVVNQYPDLAATFTTRFRQAFGQLKDDCAYAEIEQGDSFRIADVNPNRIFWLLRQIIEALETVYAHAQIRAGGDYGWIKFNERDNFPEQGEALRVAARLEPLSKPNQILVTERFAERAAQRWALDFVEAREGDVAAPYREGKHNISKCSNTEPELWVKLLQRKL